MTATELLLIRHGQTAGNQPGLGAPLAGWADLPLTSVGHKQSQCLRRQLALELPADALYSSPSQRALDTAKALLQHSLQPLALLPDLREIHCGLVEGWAISDIPQCYPELWLENQRQRDPQFRWPGGESYEEFRWRALGALRRIAASHPGQRVLVVTHCGFISQVLGTYYGLSPARWEAFRPGNASITRVTWQADRAVPLRFDARDHLEALGADDQSPLPCALRSC